MKQHEAVLLAMKQAGGYATLGQLYQTAPNIPGCEWKTKTPFANIRRIVQERKEFFRIRPGLWALTSEKARVLELFAAENKKGKEREYSHYYFQGLVVEIGNLQGFQTFVPSQDKNRPFAGGRLGDAATMAQLPEFTYRDVLRKALTIDVSWLNDRNYPDSFYEIEHSTDINGALLKFTEFQDFQTRFFIVADRHRKAEFTEKLKAGVFRPIHERVTFWDYEAVSKLHSKISETTLLQRAMR